MLAKMAANEIRTHARTNQTFLLTYPEDDLSLWRLVFYFYIWYGRF